MEMGMAEPSTASVVAVSAVGAGLAGVLAGINGAAAVGALCGAVIFFIAASEFAVRTRLVLFLISFIMGYLFAPAVAKAKIEWLGVGPIDLPGPAAFMASAMVVTVTLAAIRSRSRSAPMGG